MDGFQRRTLRKRRIILEKAEEMISDLGFSRTKVTDIAEAAGVSPVTIYNYFGSKAGLLRAVVAGYMERRWKRFTEITEAGKPFSETIRLLLEAERVDDESEHRLWESIPAEDPGVREIRGSFYRNRMRPAVLELIREGKDEGYVDPDLSEEALILHLELFREALGRAELLTPGKRVLRHEVARLFFYGLVGPDRAKRRVRHGNPKGAT